MSQGTARFFSYLTLVGLMATVFVVPLMYFPFTLDVLELPKQAVLVLGACFSATCLMIQMFVESRSLPRPGVSMIFPVMLLVAVACSTVMSLYPSVSIIGQTGQQYTSLLTLVACLLLFTVAKDIAHRRLGYEYVMLALFASTTVSSVILIPALLGHSWLLVATNLGTPFTAGVYFLVVTLLICGRWFIAKGGEPTWYRWLANGASVVTMVVTLWLLLVLDLQILWILGLVGSGVLLIFAFLHADRWRDPIRFLPAFSWLVLMIIFTVANSPLTAKFPAEINLDQATTMQMARAMWADHGWWWGTGPGTFPLVYDQYRPVSLNATEYWNAPFISGHDWVTTQLATTGIVVVVCWILVVLSLLIGACVRIFVGRDRWRETVAVLAPWMVLTAAAFLYIQNVTLITVFWVLSGLLAGSLTDSHSVKDRAFQSRLLTVLATMLVAMVALVSLAIMVPVTVADIIFTRAMRMNTFATTTQELDRVILRTNSAIKMNAFNDAYYRNLAGVLVRRLAELTEEEAQDEARVQAIVVSIVNTVRQVTELSPYQALNWEMKGLAYHKLSEFVPDAVEPLQSAYEQTISLAPTNPNYRLSAAQAYIAVADYQVRFFESKDETIVAQAKADHTAALDKAEEHLAAALRLKSDFDVAKYYQSIVEDRRGDYVAAVTILESLREQYRGDTGIGLQLAALYMKQKDLSASRAELERVIDIDPGVLYAHWYLSLLNEQEGDLDAAITEMERVMEIDAMVEGGRERLMSLKTRRGDLVLESENEDAVIGPELAP